MAKDPQKKLQMADIARLAGVSVSTVSRALSGSSLVNEETRQRVAELARSMNYTINLGAQALRLRKNQTIAVVVPFDATTRQHISDPFFLAIVGALADALTERGYDMLLSRVDLEQLDTAARLVDGGKAIGLIVIGQWRHHEQLNALADRGVPLVVWGAHMPHQRYCSVGGDNLAGGLVATRHLLAAGRRHIAFLGDASLPEVMLRHEGHLQALAEAGIARDALLDLPVPFEVGAARATLDALFASGTPVDGVLACSDLLALQALQAAQAAGREVPRDVAVVGYDDMPLAAYSSPALTSVHQPLDQAGTNIVDALLGLLAGETVAPRTLPVHLVVRDSAP
ncbi:MAG: LacI family DNA-binding transcriptional regulator [Rubrivivax sp.]|jgi:DNA-binding LacI/PurR family transcriptional regulator